MDSLTNIREVLQDSALHGQLVEIGIQEGRDALRQWRGSFLAHSGGGVCEQTGVQGGGGYWGGEVQPESRAEGIKRKQRVTGGIRAKK